MAENSKIEWTDHTFNPWVGCTKISPACDHCYAEGWAKRTGGAALWRGERRRTTEANWRQPLKWNREAEASGIRRKVFCASLADVFDNQVPAEWRADLWRLIDETPGIDWLLLTKRPQNIVKMMPAVWIWPPSAMPRNIWLGTTVENQAEAERRIPELLTAPAAVRFLSCEPLLGPIDLPLAYLNPVHDFANLFGGARVDWVICGGESGPEARPTHPDWARSLRDQCAAESVPFFFKQWGEWLHQPERAHFKELAREPWRRADSQRPGVRPALMFKVGKKRAGALLDGREWREVPDACPLRTLAEVAAA